MARTASTDRIARAFARTVDAESPAIEILRRTAGVLADAVPADYWCGILLDPATLLDTGGHFESSFPDEVMPRLFEIEHVEHVGADNLRSLARRTSRVSVLSESAASGLHDDVYYRDILRPLGMSDEMRVVLRQGPHVWGLLVWCRSGGFSSRDTTLADALARPAARALRSSFVLSGADAGEPPDAPGLLVLDPDHNVVSITPTAGRWIDELQEKHASSRLPNTVRALAMRAGAAPAYEPAGSIAQTRAGRWAALHGWALDDSRVAISVGPAGLHELIAIVLAAYDLTRRERDVTQLVLRGRSTAQVARALALSPYTVQDHLRSVFRKVDVGSSRELMAAIFTRHYLPQLGPDGEPPLSTDGRLRMAAG